MAAARKKDWCFTVHSGNFGNKTEEEVIEDLKQVVCTYIVFQLETGGELGRDHIQGYVMFKGQKTLPAAQAALGFPTCHMEMRQAPKISDAVKYCKKDDTRRPGTTWWEKGTEPMDQGIKRTLADACELARTKGVKRVAIEMPEEYVKFHRGLEKLAQISAGEGIPQQRPVTCYYVWGDSGCGKSWWANTLFDNGEDTYTTTDMPDKIWMGNYAGERTLVIEEFEGLCNPSLMKAMLEGYKMEFQTKGGFVWAQWDVIILTSNCDPKTLYDSKVNWWSVLPTPPGPFQRRFQNGTIHGRGNYEMGTAQFDRPLPIREERLEGAAPDDPIDIDVPGAAFEPITPGTQALIDTLELDDFIEFD